MTVSPVESYTEWDQLEEVIVGAIDGAAVPDWNEPAVRATMPRRHAKFFQRNAGRPFPEEFVNLARQELDAFASLLTELGVTVVRPSAADHGRPFTTPNWRSRGGLYSAMPRDSLLVVGETIIEAPMAWRSRYFEVDAYRDLLIGYFSRGAKWISAPRPRLLDASYDDNFDPETPCESGRYVTREHEPTFDAADFIRCGRDIFAQRSHVTNMLGIDWVARTIGSEYTVHVIEVNDSAPMHIDASFMPLAPGKLLLNPKRVKTIPKIFDSWDVRFAPAPTVPDDHVLYMSSAWISMNIFMVNEKQVVAESQEQPLIELLDDWGFEVLPVDFRNTMRFGGSFHCVTCDLRRSGELRSYFR